MYGATKGIRRALVMGVVCLSLIVSNVSASQASTSQDTELKLARYPCWLCW